MLLSSASQTLLLLYMSPYLSPKRCLQLCNISVEIVTHSTNISFGTSKSYALLT